MSTDASHEQLKLLAREFLLRRGFPENQIFMEIPVVQMGQKIQEYFCETDYTLAIRKGIVSDVIGIKDGYSVAIECGNTPSERLEQLRLFFDEVIYLPFVGTVESLYDLAALRKEIDELQKEKVQLQQELKENKEKYQNLLNQIRRLLPY